MQTFSVLGLRPACVALAAMGRDHTEILRKAGIEPEAVGDPDARVPVSAAFRVFELAVAATENEAFGLRAAEAIPLGSLEVVDLAARSAATARAGITQLARYYAFIDDGAELDITSTRETVTIARKNVRNEEAPLAAVELLFGAIVLRGRQLTGSAPPVRAVRFRQPAPKDPAPHDAFFGVPVTFGWPRNELELEASWLDRPILGADPAVSSLVERFLRSLTASLPKSDDVVDRARRAIAEDLSSGEPPLEAVARRLAMSTRTLQRRLRDGGRSYAEVVEEVRRELALAQLAERRLSIAEVGYMLGFSEPSAFHRAFRRWTGLTPSEYRKARAGG
ncbi:MAG TPA: AraC family transcriptional regulator [Polyangiaceae bacterium]